MGKHDGGRRMKKQLRKARTTMIVAILVASTLLLNGCDRSKGVSAALAERSETITQVESKEEGNQEEGSNEAASQDLKALEQGMENGQQERQQEQENKNASEENIGNTDTITLEQQEQKLTGLTRVHLVAAGDDLLHETVIKGGLMEDGSYDYSCFFSNLLDIFEGADIAAINQETIMGGEEKGYSGYPRFNSPDAIADAIYEAGFDVVLQANNHTLDMGISGLSHAISVWNHYPSVMLLGVHENEEQYNRIQTITCNGITIAMLNYTYGFNGNILPSDAYYMADTLNRDKMKNDIEKAKEIADFVIVFPHWGTEYVYKPDSSELSLAQFFADQGVDLVIGGHPHVLQTAEWLTGENGNQTFVYYSLGNYISSMNYTDRMLGGLADVIIAKHGEKTYLESVNIIPIVTHYERGDESNFGVYRLTDYTEEMAKRHFIYGTQRGSDFSISRLWELTNQIVGEWVE